jgi:outer membrane cobalamin receptor
VIVDGVRLQGGLGSAVRNLRQIPATDVASVQVLKGASSAFVYGAPDGVILIETVSRTPER